MTLSTVFIYLDIDRSICQFIDLSIDRFPGILQRTRTLGDRLKTRNNSAEVKIPQILLLMWHWQLIASFISAVFLLLVGHEAIAGGMWVMEKILIKATFFFLRESKKNISNIYLHMGLWCFPKIHFGSRFIVRKGSLLEEVWNHCIKPSPIWQMSIYLKVSATNFYDVHLLKMSCLQVQVDRSLGL